MTTTVNLDHNIGDLVSDIDDVQSDITHEMRKRVGRAMTRLWADTRQYVLDDPHASGDLFAAIEQSERIGDEMLTFKVFADTSEDAAPYAAVTEFGSGERLNTPYSTAKKVPPPTPEEQPPD